MTGRAWQISAAICIMVILGLASRNREVLALALPLVIYLGVGLLSAPDDVEIRAERRIGADRAAYAMPVQAALMAENVGPAVEELHLEDVVPPALQFVDGVRRVVLPLAAGGRVELSYNVRGSRGEFTFAETKVEAYDHFGLFCVARSIGTSHQLLIYPRIVPLKRIDICPERTHGFAGPIPARRAGSGVDFYGVREYVLGDQLRKINWRVSARHDRRFFTNEFEQESLADIGLILDGRTQANIRTDRGGIFEYSVQATASLADFFLKEGHRVGLLIYGAATRVHPGYGAPQRERILNALARSRTQFSYAFESLDNLPTRSFPPHSQLVVVGPILPQDVAVLLRLRSLGYAMLIVSPDPVDFELQSLHSVAGLDLAIRLARIERSLSLATLQRAGVQVVNWQITEPLSQSVLRTFAQRGSPRRQAVVLR